jgi:transcription elongation factor GreA
MTIDPTTTTFQDTGDDTEQVLVTKEGLKKLQDELIELKGPRRKQVAERLKEAISYGDLSENSEYEEAKNEQAFIEGRILELEQKIKNAKIIAGNDTAKKTVQLGSEVTIQEKGSKEKESFTIVGSTEADPFEKKISNESPVGKALIGTEKGDIIKVKAPNGETEYEVLNVQ